MIRLTFYILLAIMIAVGAAWISSNPGDVLISWQGWEIRFSVAVLVFLSFLYTAFIFAIIRLLKWLNFSRYFSSPERLAAKRTKAGQDLDQAWSSYALGDYADAIKFGLRAKAKLGEDHNVLRLLASATRMLGEDKNPYLDALKKSDLSTTWVDKQELDDLISLKSWNRAKPLIARMLQHHPKNGQLLLLDFICNTHLNRWKEAKSALETLSKNKGSIDPILSCSRSESRRAKV
jgi:HemY protein